MLVRYISAVVAIVFILLASGGRSEGAPPLIAGHWYEDRARSDDLRRFLQENIHYIDVSAIRFRGTRSRGVMVGGNFRRKMSDKQLNETLDFLGSIVPLKPVVRIEQNDTEVNLLYHGDEVREVPLPGADLPETRQTTASKKDQSLVLAAWEEGVLVIETNSTSGVNVVERIGLDRASQEVILRIETIIRTPRLPLNLVFNRYYKPYPPLE